MSTRTHFLCAKGLENNEIVIHLSDGAIEKLFNEAFEGWCPVCRDNQINDGEIVCRDCLMKAMAYHHEYCGCRETSEEEAIAKQVRNFIPYWETRKR